MASNKKWPRPVAERNALRVISGAGASPAAISRAQWRAIKKRFILTRGERENVDEESTKPGHERTFMGEINRVRNSGYKAATFDSIASQLVNSGRLPDQ
jgi:hypothetical protein